MDCMKMSFTPSRRLFVPETCSLASRSQYEAQSPEVVALVMPCRARLILCSLPPYLLNHGILDYITFLVISVRESQYAEVGLIRTCSLVGGDELGIRLRPRTSQSYWSHAVWYMLSCAACIIWGSACMQWLRMMYHTGVASVIEYENIDCSPCSIWHKERHFATSRTILQCQLWTLWPIYTFSVDCHG